MQVNLTLVSISKLDNEKEIAIKKTDLKLKRLEDDIERLKKESKIVVETDADLFQSDENIIEKYTEKVEFLKRIAIELQEDVKKSEEIKERESDGIDIINEININQTRYNIKDPYSKFINNLKSPLSRPEIYKYRDIEKILNAAQKGGSLDELSFEVFRGWKISNKNSDTNSALLYYSMFLFLKGLDFIGINYINSRIFLRQAIITNHKLIGYTEESQKYRDLSLILILNSYLIENNFVILNDKTELLENKDPRFNLNTTLESLISHNMITQLLDIIEELCFFDDQYSINMFADYLSNDKTLFNKTFSLIQKKIYCNKLNLVKFTLEMIFRQFRDNINKKKINNILNEYITNDKIDFPNQINGIIDQINKLAFNNKNEKEKIEIVFNLASRSDKLDPKITSLPSKDKKIVMRNLTTYLPLQKSTSIVVEVINNTGNLLTNCSLLAKSNDKSIKIKRISISDLETAYPYEFEIPILIEMENFNKNPNNITTDVSIILSQEEGGEWKQLALIAKSIIQIQKRSPHITYFFTDGSPRLQDRAMIFGRESEFSKIESAFKGVETDRTLMIYGERGNGKTTLWKCMAHDYFNRYYHVITIDFDKDKDKSEKRIYKGLLNKICDTYNISNQNVLGKYDWKDEVLADFADSLDTIKDDHLSMQNDYKKILLIFDEFNIATEKFSTGEWNSGFLGQLRHIMSNHHDWISIILCGIPKYRDVMKNYEAALYREGFPIRIDPLTKIATEQLIKMNAPNVDFSKKAINRIIKAVGTNPNHVHRFCLKLMEDVLNKNARMKDNKVFCTETDIRKNEEICINDDFISYEHLLQIKSGSTPKYVDQIEALSVLSEATRNTDDYIGIEVIDAIYRRYNLPIPDYIVQDLQVLNDKDLIEIQEDKQLGKTYSIRFSMLKYWAIKNKPFKRIVTELATKEKEGTEIIGEENLLDYQKKILKILFPKREWLSVIPKKISSGQSDTSCYLIETQTRNLDKGSPFFVKIGQYENIECEINNHNTVTNLNVKMPKIVKISANSPQEAPCRCQKNCPGKSCKTKYIGVVFEFAKTYHDVSVHEFLNCIRKENYTYNNLENDLRQIFDQSLGSFYNQPEIKKRKFNSLGYYGLSTPCISEVKVKYKIILDTMCIPSFNNNKTNFIVDNPIQIYLNYIKPNKGKEKNMIVGNSHGDLHSQNILKDTCDITWIIDWRHFSTIGHFSRDFTLLESSIIANIDYTQENAIEFAEIIPNLIKQKILLDIEEYLTPNYSENVSKAITAHVIMFNTYVQLLNKYDLSFSNEKFCGEYFISLFLNLIAMSSRPNTTKFGGEICLYFAGLLKENVKNYCKITF